VKVIPRLVRATEILSKAGGWVGVCACLLIMFVVTANVASRFLIKAIPGTLEITQGLMVVTVAMLLAYTLARRGHVNIEFVVERFPNRLQRVLDIFSLVLALGFTVLLAWQGWNMGLVALDVMDASSSPPYVPYYPAKLIFAVGVSLFCLQLIIEIWQRIAGFLAKEVANVPPNQ